MEGLGHGGQNGLAPVVPGRGRGHRRAGVLPQQLGHRGDVALLDGVHEPLKQRALGLAGMRGRRPIQPASRQLLLQRRPCALQGTVHRGNARVEQRGRLLGRPPEHVAEDQHGPLSRREELDRGQERDLDRLPGDDHRLRLIVARRDPLEQVIRIGLQPG
jgi:hypothetical protein